MAQTSVDDLIQTTGQTFVPQLYSVRDDVLAPNTIAALLYYVQANAARFMPATVRNAEEPAVNAAIRVSSLLRDMGPFQTVFETLLGPLTATLAGAFGMPLFAASKFELEFVAHNDDAFFLRHIDTFWDRTARSQRMLSGIYYFHAMPKSFEGGVLRLHGAKPGADGMGITDVEPVHNRLVFFPSWLSHEVSPVRCSSRRFIDSRFAVNCWIHRAAP